MGFTTLSLTGRALRLLSQREHSWAELQRKLGPHVQDGEDLNAVLDGLQAKGFISEERVVESVLNRRASRLGAWGPSLRCNSARECSRWLSKRSARPVSDSVVKPMAEDCFCFDSCQRLISKRWQAI